MLHKQRGKSASWQHLYKTKQWKMLRQQQLSLYPLCAFCLLSEEVTEANIVDHRKRHDGDVGLFFDPDNLQSLCKHHHDSAKQSMERGKTVVFYGVDGYPVEFG